MKNIIQSIQSNLAWSVVALFGLSVSGLWLLFQNDVVQCLLALQSKGILALGWTLAILILLWSGTGSYALYLRSSLLINNYDIDDETETAIDRKTSKHYCPNCLLNRKKSPMILSGNYYRCVNKSCPNSEVKAATA